jgi:hypothetical protein
MPVMPYTRWLVHVDPSLNNCIRRLLHHPHHNNGLVRCRQVRCKLNCVPIYFVLDTDICLIVEDRPQMNLSVLVYAGTIYNFRGSSVSAGRRQTYIKICYSESGGILYIHKMYTTHQGGNFRMIRTTEFLAFYLLSKNVVQ